MQGLLRTNTLLQLFKPIASLSKGDGKVRDSAAEIEFGRILAALKLQNTPGFLKLVQPPGAGNRAKTADGEGADTMMASAVLGKLRIRPTTLPDDVRKSLSSIITGFMKGQETARPQTALKIELPQLQGTAIRISPNDRKAQVVQTDASDSAFSLLDPGFLSLLEEAGMESVRFVSEDGGQIEIKFSANPQVSDLPQEESLVSNIKKLVSEISEQPASGNRRIRRTVPVQETGSEVTLDFRQTAASLTITIEVPDAKLARRLGKAIPEIEAVLQKKSSGNINVPVLFAGKNVAAPVSNLTHRVPQASMANEDEEPVSSPKAARAPRKVAIEVRVPSERMAISSMSSRGVEKDASGVVGAKDRPAPTSGSGREPVKDVAFKADAGVAGRGTIEPRQRRTEKHNTVPQPNVKKAPDVMRPERASQPVKDRGAAMALNTTNPRATQPVQTEAILDQVEQIVASFTDPDEGLVLEHEFELAGKEKAVLQSEMKSSGPVHKLQVSSLDLKEKLQARLHEKGLDVPEVEMHNFEEVKVAKGTTLPGIEPSVPNLASIRETLPELPAKLQHKIEQLFHRISEKVERAPELQGKKEAIRSELRELLTVVRKAAISGEPLEFEHRSGDPKVREFLSASFKGVIKEISKEMVAAGLVKGSDLLPKVSDKGVSADKTAATNSIQKSAATQTAARQESPAHDSGDDSAPKQQSARTADGGIKSETKTKSTSEAPMFQSQVSRKAEVVHAAPAQSAGTVALDFSNGKLMPQAPVESSQMAEMIKKISDLAAAQTSFTGQKLEVQMEVKDVGRVLVDALRHMDKIDLRIQVDSQEARKIVENQIRPMVEQMARDGVEIGKLDVSVRDHRQDQSRQQSFEGNSSRLSERSSREEFSQGNPQRYPRQFSDSQLRQMMTGEQTVEIWI